MSLGGGSQQTGQTVTRNELPAFARDFGRRVTTAGAPVYEQGIGRLTDPSRYTPSQARQIAPFSQDHTTAFGDIRSRTQAGNPMLGPALDYGTNLVGQGGLTSGQQTALDQIGQTAAGDFLTSNPFADDLAQQAAQRANDMISLRFNQSGRFGSPGFAKAAGRGITEAQLPFLSNIYESERGRQEAARRDILGGEQQGVANVQSAIQQLPTLNQARFADPLQLAALGDVQQQQTQAEQDALYNYQALQGDTRFAADQAALNAALGGRGLGAGAGTRTTTQYQPYSPASNILGGLAGVGGLLGFL